MLLCPGQLWVWYGAESSEPEREVAKATAYSMLQERDLVEVDEGQEPAEFWTPLGGKQPYVAFSPTTMPEAPRLFLCASAAGSMRVELIVGFTQVRRTVHSL